MTIYFTSQLLKMKGNSFLFYVFFSYSMNYRFRKLFSIGTLVLDIRYVRTITFI